MRLAAIITRLEARGGPFDDAWASAAAGASPQALASFIPAGDKPALRAVLPEALADAFDAPHAGPAGVRSSCVQWPRRPGWPRGVRWRWQKWCTRRSSPTRGRGSCDIFPTTWARTQRASVAAWDGTRDDTTLGGYHGPREGNTLADGASDGGANTLGGDYGERDYGERDE